ncbi:MAG: T9SS type A sorting domain-containing protein [Candidatus Neomarinimicrobiota bacterium]
MDIERPIISMEVGRSLISYDSDIIINSTFIYNDTLSYFIDYSLNDGLQWTNQVYLDTLSNRFNMTYNWNVFDEIGWNYLENVKLRFYANNESISSDTIIIDSLIIANIAGDYIYEPESELGIQANDISRLLSIFYEESDSLGYHDIGPSSGVAPNIMSEPDNKINFEDLSTFTQMWYWSNNYFSPITVIEMKNADVRQSHHFQIINESSLENTRLSNYQLNLNSSDDEFRGLDLVLKYDPNLINIESIHLGDIFDEKFLTLESLDKVDGRYTLSLWTKDDTFFNVKGNWLNLILTSTNDNDIFSKADLYLEPHKFSHKKEPIHYYALDVRSEELIPETFFLSQNYPNPFNPITKIDYALSKESHVDLVIYNISGRQVKVLINQVESPGFRTIEWNGLDQNGRNLGTGIYFYRLTLGDETHTRKMIYMK